ncbi:hypothetical protein M9H77_03077 [Catharanthus roseus]|uniref:Uncharacterized protein n=1 Tax=Catharanthus roseus TaxID=4058 RepID=A0ACC0CAD6_CATRO|nr:hypothetical protein M9H77_03077 [Catharanthus roseus]
MKGTSRGRWVRRIAQGLNSAPEGEDCSSLLRVNLLIKNLHGGVRGGHNAIGWIPNKNGNKHPMVSTWEDKDIRADGKTSQLKVQLGTRGGGFNLGRVQGLGLGREKNHELPYQQFAEQRGRAIYRRTA